MIFKITPDPKEYVPTDQLPNKAGRNFIYHQSSQPFYKNMILLKNLDSYPELYINRAFNYIYKIKLLVRSLQITERTFDNEATVHGAAVENPQTKEGIIITAWADVGKSTNTLLLAHKGYKILSDDEVTLNQEGKLRRLHNTANIFPHPSNLKLIQGITTRERILAWIKINFAKYSFMNKILSPNFCVKYNRIGEVIDSSYCKRIYILEKSEQHDIQPVQKDEAVKKILATSARLWHLSGFPRNIVTEYCFANNININFVENRFKRILDSAMKDISVFRVRGQKPHDFNVLIVENEEKLQSQLVTK